MSLTTFTRAEARSDTAAHWRRALRREIAWIVALKLAALCLLWALFFRT